MLQSEKIQQSKRIFLLEVDKSQFSWFSDSMPKISMHSQRVNLSPLPPVQTHGSVTASTQQKWLLSQHTSFLRELPSPPEPHALAWLIWATIFSLDIYKSVISLSNECLSKYTRKNLMLFQRNEIRQSWAAWRFCWFKTLKRPVVQYFKALHYCQLQEESYSFHGLVWVIHTRIIVYETK